MTPGQQRANIAPELHRLGLAFALAVLLVAQALFMPSFSAVSPALAPWLLAVLGAASALSLITVGRWPIGSLAVMSLAVFAYTASDAPAGLLWVAPVVATYTVSNTFGRRYGLLAALVTALALAMPATTSLTPVGAAVNVLRMVVLTAAAAAFGEANRSRRERAIEAEARAAEAESAREAQAALAVDEERLRIARELHDVTAHSLSVISIQSELARRTLRSAPETAEGALEAIGDTSRQALAELRSMLGHLRGDEVSAAPSPSLARLSELESELRMAGIEVSLAVSGDLAALPPFVDATAFRIMQEAVTNLVRHASARHAILSVERDATSVHVAVLDDGLGVSDSQGQAAGHGLIGMRERAAAIGGTFSAGPSEAGWRVEATLPVATGSGEGER